MDFDLTQEQQLLKDSIDRLMLDRYDFESRKTFQSSPEGWSRELWKQYAELGLLGLPFAEADGGFGGGAIETMLVMEAFGRALVVEPYFSCVTLAGGALRRAANDKQRATLMAPRWRNPGRIRNPRENFPSRFRSRPRRPSR